MSKAAHPVRRMRVPRALTSQQEKALHELLVQPTIRKAADNAGVSESTLRRWLAGHAGFRARYRDSRRELFEGGAKHLCAASMSAANTLWQIAREDRHSAAARVSAARAIIEFSVRGIEMLDVLPRLETVEMQLALAEPDAALEGGAAR